MADGDAPPANAKPTLPDNPNVQAPTVWRPQPPDAAPPKAAAPKPPEAKGPPPVVNDAPSGDGGSMLDRLRGVSAAPKQEPKPTPPSAPPASSGASDHAAPTGKAATEARNRSAFAPPPGMEPYKAPTPVLAMGFKDCEGYYTILDCDFDLPDELLKSQFMMRSEMLHPDKNTGPYACEEMSLLNTAYKTLRDRAQRANYDRRCQIAYFNAVGKGGTGKGYAAPKWNQKGKGKDKGKDYYQRARYDPFIPHPRPKLSKKRKKKQRVPSSDESWVGDTGIGPDLYNYPRDDTPEAWEEHQRVRRQMHAYMADIDARIAARNAKAKAAAKAAKERREKEQRDKPRGRSPTQKSRPPKPDRPVPPVPPPKPSQGAGDNAAPSEKAEAPAPAFAKEGATPGQPVPKLFSGLGHADAVPKPSAAPIFVPQWPGQVPKAAMPRPPSGPPPQQDPLNGFYCLGCRLGTPKTDTRHTYRKDQCTFYLDPDAVRIGVPGPTTAPPDDLPAYTPFGPAAVPASNLSGKPVVEPKANAPFSADYSQFYASTRKVFEKSGPKIDLKSAARVEAERLEALRLERIQAHQYVIDSYRAWLSALLVYNASGGQDLDKDSLDELWAHYQDYVQVYLQFKPKWICYTERIRVKQAAVDVAGRYADESDEELTVNLTKELLHAKEVEKKSRAAGTFLDEAPPKKAPVDLKKEKREGKRAKVPVPKGKELPADWKGHMKECPGFYREGERVPSSGSSGPAPAPAKASSGASDNAAPLGQPSSVSVVTMGKGKGAHVTQTTFHAEDGSTVEITTPGPDTASAAKHRARLEHEATQRARAEAEEFYHYESVEEAWYRDQEQGRLDVVEEHFNDDVVMARADATTEAYIVALEEARRQALEEARRAENVNRDDLSIPPTVPTVHIGDTQYFDMAAGDSDSDSSTGDASDCTMPSDNDGDDPPAPPGGQAPVFANLQRPQQAPGEINLDSDSSSDILSPAHDPAGPPPQNDVGTGATPGASDHAAPKDPPAQPPAPPAPETPPPDIVLQVGENTVLYQIPGPQGFDINITWTFQPTGDLETDLAEQRRVGRLAGRIARQLPPPTTDRLRDRLVHRLDVVMAAERYGFTWDDREEVVFKAPPPDLPTPQPEFIDQLQAHLINNNGTHQSGKEKLRKAILDEIMDPDLQRGLIASMQFQPAGDAQEEPPPVPMQDEDDEELPDFADSLPDLDAVGPDVATVPALPEANSPAKASGTGGTDEDALVPETGVPNEPVPSSDSEEQIPENATHVLPGVTNTDGGGLFNTDSGDEPEEPAPNLDGNILNDFSGSGIPIWCNMRSKPPSTSSRSQSPPRPPQPSEEPAAKAVPAEPPRDQGDFLGLRPASTVTVIDANGMMEVQIGKPHPDDEKKRKLGNFLKGRMVGAAEMAGDSPLFAADDAEDDEDPPGASDHAAPTDGGASHDVAKAPSHERPKTRQGIPIYSPEEKPAKLRERLEALKKRERLVPPPAKRKTVRFDDAASAKAARQEKEEDEKPKASSLIPPFNSFKKQPPIASNDELLKKLGTELKNDDDGKKATLKKSKRAEEVDSRKAERAVRRRTAAEPMSSSDSSVESTSSESVSFAGPPKPVQSGKVEKPQATDDVAGPTPNDGSDGGNVGPVVEPAPAGIIPVDLDSESDSSVADDDTSDDAFSKCQVCGEDYSSSLTSCPYCARPSPVDCDHASTPAGTADAAAGPVKADLPDPPVRTADMPHFMELDPKSGNAIFLRPGRTADSYAGPMIKGSMKDLPIQVPPNKPKGATPADSAAKAYGVDVRQAPKTPPGKPKSRLKKKNASAVPRSASAPPPLIRPPGMPAMMPTGKAKSEAKAAAKVSLKPRASSVPPKAPPQPSRIGYLHRRVQEWQKNNYVGVYASDSECFDEMLEYIGYLINAGFTVESLAPLLRAIDQHVTVSPEKAAEIIALTKAKAKAVLKPKAPAQDPKPAPTPEPKPAATADATAPAVDPTEITDIVAVEPFDVHGLSMQAIDDKLREMRKRQAHGVRQVPRSSSSSDKPRLLSNKQVKKAERSLRRLVNKRSEEGRLSAPTERDSIDTGRDRALARTQRQRARREALVEGARIRGLTVSAYARQLRAAGDATEEDFLDAEIADADTQRPDDKDDKDDSPDDKNDKGDAPKKASL